jgi:hypothetical protein
MVFIKVKKVIDFGLGYFTPLDKLFILVKLSVNACKSGHVLNSSCI